MRAQPNRQEDKRLLQNLCEALKCPKNSIYLDECGDWNINGNQGHIYTDAIWWYLSFDAETVRKGNKLKRQLSFMEMQLDLDTGGVFRMKDMPNEEQSAAVRKAMKIRLAPQYSETHRATLKNRFKTPIETPPSE